jgi:hypothetical protein
MNNVNNISLLSPLVCACVTKGVKSVRVILRHQKNVDYFTKGSRLTKAQIKKEKQIKKQNLKKKIEKNEQKKLIDIDDNDSDDEEKEEDDDDDDDVDDDDDDDDIKRDPNNPLVGYSEGDIEKDEFYNIPAPVLIQALPFCLLKGGDKVCANKIWIVFFFSIFFLFLFIFNYLFVGELQSFPIHRFGQ